MYTRRVCGNETDDEIENEYVSVVPLSEYVVPPSLEIQYFLIPLSDEPKNDNVADKPTVFTLVTVKLKLGNDLSIRT